MADSEKGSLRVREELDEIHCTIVNNDDPQRLGRVQIAPNNLDRTQVNEDDLPWAYIQTAGSQSGIGGTLHCFAFPGDQWICKKSHDGTYRAIASVSTSTGPDAQPGESRYPGNMTTKKA